MRSIASTAGRRASLTVESLLKVEGGGIEEKRQVEMAGNGVLVGAASEESLTL